MIDVNKGKGVLEIYEQNVKPRGKKVQRHTLSVRNLTPTTETKTRFDEVIITTTTRITVEGTVWACRPAAR